MCTVSALTKGGKTHCFFYTGYDENQCSLWWSLSPLDRLKHIVLQRNRNLIIALDTNLFVTGGSWMVKH